jgi:hypothetical protein
MPRISKYYGIAIYMYYQDHAPPHVHAIYGDNEAVFDIATGKKLEGELPKRAAKLVSTWARLHRQQLQENWERAQAGEPLQQIEPLE